jgi:hypothetical protein
MPADKMHTDEVDTSAAVVTRLLAAQFPHWADLPITAAPSAGTDNAPTREAIAASFTSLGRNSALLDKLDKWEASSSTRKD